MGTDKHSELEKKFAADHVDPEGFRAWGMKMEPFEFVSDSYPDVYYRRGDNVVRHRLKDGAGELTVKQRKSLADITNRKEVDLTFGHDTNAGDVEAFLIASGWARDVFLNKTFTNTFWLRTFGATVTVSLYEVELEDGTGTRRFLEVEVEKGSEVTPARANFILESWTNGVRAHFQLGEALNESLYEIYSGRRYLLAQ